MGIDIGILRCDTLIAGRFLVPKATENLAAYHVEVLYKPPHKVILDLVDGSHSPYDESFLLKQVVNQLLGFRSANHGLLLFPFCYFLSYSIKGVKITKRGQTIFKTFIFLPLLQSDGWQLPL